MKQFETFCKIPTRGNTNGLSQDSQRILKTYLTKYLSYIKDETPNFQNLVSFIAFLEVKPSSKCSIAQRLGRFLYFYEYITREQLSIIYQKFYSPSPKWSSKALNIQDVSKIISSSWAYHNDDFLRYRNTLFLYLLGTLGLRIGQALSIKTTDVNIGETAVEIKIKKLKQNFKNQTELYDTKTIPINHSIQNHKLISLLKGYLEIKPKSEYLFVNKNGRKCNEAVMRQFCYNIGKKIGIKFTPHQLRHSVGTYVANQYGLLKASLLLGHSDIKTTQRYVEPQKIDLSNCLPSL